MVEMDKYGKNIMLNEFPKKWKNAGSFWIKMEKFRRIFVTVILVLRQCYASVTLLVTPFLVDI